MSSQKTRAIGVYEKDGIIYWGNDGSGEPGIFKCPVADINDNTKYVKLVTTGDSCYEFRNNGQYVLSGYQSGVKKHVSKDYGETWEEIAQPSTFATAQEKGYFNEKHKFFLSQFADVVLIVD